MKLPEKFQMRVKDDEGFTHSCTVIGDRVKVKWARGWHEKRFAEEPYEDGDSLWTTVDLEQAEMWVRNGGWIVVEEPEQKKQEETLPDRSAPLPDVFYFKLHPEDDPEIFKATKRFGDGYLVTWESSGMGKRGMNYTQQMVEDIVAEGSWKIIDKKHPTAEQQRANKEIREQINALNSSIRISEQNVEHQNRLQANYRERIEQLKEKIVEGE